VSDVTIYHKSYNGPGRCNAAGRDHHFRPLDQPGVAATRHVCHEGCVLRQECATLK